MDWAMSRPAFKTQLFRFVDVFPALEERDDIARHLAEYFDGVEVPEGARPRRRPGRQGARSAPPSRPASPARTSPGWPSSSSSARRPAEAVAGLHGALAHRAAPPPSTCSARRPSSAPRPTATRPGCSSCSTRCARRRPSWAPDDHLERDDLGPLPRVNVSIKPTALATHYEPLSRREGLERAKERIRPDPADGPRPRRPRALRHGALRRQGPHPRAVPRAAVRGRVRRRRGRHRDPGLPARRARRPRRPHRLVGRPRTPDHRAAGEGRVLGRRDRARPGQRAGRRRCSRTRTRPTPTTSAAPGCSTTTTARCAPPSDRTTSARSPTR